MNIACLPVASLHSLRRHRTFILIPLLIACIGSLPSARAVSPAPDGGYPGGNTAEGQDALLSLMTGTYNTAVGIYSLLSLADGNFCTGVGAGTLLSNTADQITATGAGALLSNTEGTLNTATGAFALFRNTTGTENTAMGADALVNNDTGNSNTANGTFALFSNIEGDRNTAIGFHALENNVANSNTAVGAEALGASTTGINNVAVGASALLNNAAGSGNTALGPAALISNIEGNDNTAVGGFALAFNTEGDLNTAVGDGALFLSVGSGNIALGNSAGANMTTADNVISIGSPGDTTAFATGDRCFIGNIRGVTVGNGDGIAVIVDSDGQLGTTNSSRLFKKDIEPMDETSEGIFALKPVTFHYKNQDTKKAEERPQFGLFAEDVAEVNPALVVRDTDGEPLSVRYEAVNAMLLNEFLKEHRKVERLQKQVEALNAGLRKVNARLEASNAASQVALQAQ